MSTVATAEAIDLSQHLPLAHLVAIRMRRWATARGFEYDDLLQQAFVGLVKAARAFDPSRGVAFATFALRLIKHEILLPFQFARCKKRLPPGKRETDFAFEQIGIEDAEPEHHFYLAEALDLLPPRARKVITWRYGFDGKGERSLREIGDHLGVSGERVRQIEASALETLRAALQR